MTHTLTPRDARDVEQAVRDAIAAEQPIEIVGHGTKRAVGHQVSTNAVLDMSALNAVVSYEPHELIITLGAGAPLADVQALIDSKNQQFAFEPMDTSALLGSAHGAGTIGGMVAAGLAGPRRIKAGGARDHLLGLTAVSGFGETFKAGGKVVKNVTGYDLCKLIAGSWGTLAAVTEMTIKVMPKAETEVTLLLRGLDDERATAAMNAALGSPYDVSAAAHVPGSVIRATGPLTGMSEAGIDSLTLVRLEGIGASVAHRANSLATALESYGAAERIAPHDSAATWTAIRDVLPFAATGPFGGRPVWRIVCPPAAGGTFGRSLASDIDAEVIYDWGGGLLWVAAPDSPDAFADLIRARLAPIGGHATLVRATEAVRGSVAVFQPQEPGVALLADRVRASFDPRTIFNRGRLKPFVPT